jgi:hypothetical protein
VTIVRELVTQAVAATGYTSEDWYRQEHHQFITVRVFGFKMRIGIEVWDRSTDLLPPSVEWAQLTYQPSQLTCRSTQIVSGAEYGSAPFPPV